MKILFCDDQLQYAEEMTQLCRRYESETGESFEMLAVDDFEKRGDFEE